ncbi:hypothetical protein ACJX0J_023712, partial [Zea mays]
MKINDVVVGFELPDCYYRLVETLLISTSPESMLYPVFAPLIALAKSGGVAFVLLLSNFIR